MEAPTHTMSALFDQLGLPSSDTDIEAFVRNHRLVGTTALASAEFWNEGQRHFIEEALAEDADWAELVDVLDARLRH